MAAIDEPELNIIYVFMCKLRKKLAAVSCGTEYVETVWGGARCSASPSASRDRLARPRATQFLSRERWLHTGQTPADAGSRGQRLRRALHPDPEGEPALWNTTWLIERHGFQTPAAVRQNQLSPAVMAA